LIKHYIFSIYDLKLFEYHPQSHTRAVMMANDMLKKKVVQNNALDYHLGDIHPASTQELYDAEE